MKTIALTVPLGMSARNILRSDIYSTLSNHARVVIFSSFSDDVEFKREFRGDNVFVEPLDTRVGLKNKVLRRLMDPIETWLFTAQTQIETLTIYRDWLKAEFPGRYWKIRLAAFLFGHKPILSLLRWLYWDSFRDSTYQKAFAKHHVDLVFVSHVFSLADQQIAINARMAGISIVGMVHSWDNLTSKSGIRQGTNPNPGRTIPIHFDRMIVWNDILKQELKDFYGYRDNEIFVSGIPQFDSYQRSQLSRKEVFEKFGADPNKKLILYAAGTPQYVKHQDEIIEMLIQMLRENRFPVPAQIAVRHHPNRMAIESLQELQRKYKDNRDVIFLTPSSLYTALPGVKWNAKEDDDADLASTLRAADVVVTMASTITLDAAALDRPIVNINFDGLRDQPYFSSLKKTFDCTHYKKIVPSGAFRIVNNAGELVREIDRYLRNPELEKTERKNLVTMVTGKLDGRAGQRIADFLLSQLGINQTSKLEEASIK